MEYEFEVENMAGIGIKVIRVNKMNKKNQLLRRWGRG